MSGWYPDPTGRFEYRYHNGAAWTADVVDGRPALRRPAAGTRRRRRRRPPPAPARARDGNGIALAGDGLRHRRRRHRAGCRSFGDRRLSPRRSSAWPSDRRPAPLAADRAAPGARHHRHRRRASVGIAARRASASSSPSSWSARSSASTTPARRRRAITSCAVEGTDVVAARRRSTNQSDATRDYTRPRRGSAPGRRATLASTVDDVAAGETARVHRPRDSARRQRAATAAATIVEVDGPLPFGLDPSLRLARAS